MGVEDLPDLLCYSGHRLSLGHVLKVKEFPSKYNGKLPPLTDLQQWGTLVLPHILIVPTDNKQNGSLDSPRYDALSFSVATLRPRLCHYANRVLLGFCTSRLVVSQVIVQTTTIMILQKENLIMFLPL